MSSAVASTASPGYAVPLARLGDERLATRVTDGDLPAFTAIYERYHQQLFRYCRSILRADGDAQDALQSTFERAFSALRRGQRNAPLRPWLFRIAHNEAITVIRRRGADEPSEHLDTGIGPSVEHTAAERARLATLLDDLADLPERPRGALVMRELGDLSHEEIAVALEITAGAAKQAIFEARRALQECAEGRAMPCDEIQRRISDGDRRALRGRRLRAHLRDCAACTAFEASIGERQAELRGLTPALAPAAAAAILARAVGTLHAGGTGAAGGGGLGAGAALGKAGMATAAVSSKLTVVAAVVATAAAGAGGVVAVVHLSAAPHRVAHESLGSSAQGASRSGQSTAGTAASRSASAPVAGSAVPVLVSRPGKTRHSAPGGKVVPSRGAAGATALVSHGAAGSSHAGGNSSTAPGRGKSSAAHARGSSNAAPGRRHSSPAHARSHGRSGQSHGRSGSAPTIHHPQPVVPKPQSSPVTHGTTNVPGAAASPRQGHA